MNPNTFVTEEVTLMLIEVTDIEEFHEYIVHRDSFGFQRAWCMDLGEGLILEADDNYWYLSEVSVYEVNESLTSREEYLALRKRKALKYK